MEYGLNVGRIFCVALGSLCVCVSSVISVNELCVKLLLLIMQRELYILQQNDAKIFIFPTHDQFFWVLNL